MSSERCSTCGFLVQPDVALGLCPRCLAITCEQESGTANSEKADEPILRTLGDYDVLEQIGQGGMGVVYRARQRSLNRPVALKIVLPSPNGPLISVRRFRIEAQAIAQLDHPNIIPIYEVGQRDDEIFYTMKLISGQSLGWHLAEFWGRSTGADWETRAARVTGYLRSVLGWIAQVAHGVHHAHLRQILHRDLKPSNILIDERSTPYLVDFGLAKITTQTWQLTPAMTIVGTPGYLSPEQAAGARALTPATDVYSLGVILFQALTGCLPLGASEEQPEALLAKVSAAESPPLRQKNPRLSVELERICRRCLARNPADRYSSAEALAIDLEQQRDQPWEVERPVGAARRAGRWWQGRFGRGSRDEAAG